MFGVVLGTCCSCFAGHTHPKLQGAMAWGMQYLAVEGILRARAVTFLRTLAAGSDACSDAMFCDDTATQLNICRSNGDPRTQYTVKLLDWFVYWAPHSCPVHEPIKHEPHSALP